MCEFNLEQHTKQNGEWGKISVVENKAVLVILGRAEWVSGWAEEEEGSLR